MQLQTVVRNDPALEAMEDHALSFGLRYLVDVLLVVVVV